MYSSLGLATLDATISAIKLIISSGVYCSPAVDAEMSAHLRLICSSSVVIAELSYPERSILAQAATTCISIFLLRSSATIPSIFKYLASFFSRLMPSNLRSTSSKAFRYSVKSWSKVLSLRHIESNVFPFITIYSLYPHSFSKKASLKSSGSSSGLIPSCSTTSFIALSIRPSSITNAKNGIIYVGKSLCLILAANSKSAIDHISLS